MVAAALVFAGCGTDVGNPATTDVGVDAGATDVGGSDGGPIEDAGSTDATADVVEDATSDVVEDTTPDAVEDTATDAVEDATDVGVDTDAGMDTDAGADADTGDDAGVDADADAGITCPPGTRADDGVCVDIDECAETPGICGHPAVTSCTNRDAAPPRCACDATSPREALLDGVDTLAFGGSLPSLLVAHGGGAFSVVVDSADRTVAAGAFVGDGRVFTIGHEGLMNQGVGGDPGLVRLMRNVAAWQTEGVDDPVIGVQPGTLDNLAANLADAGYTVVRVGVDRIAETDVWVTTNYATFDLAALGAIRTHVLAGGGLITGGHAWWWGRDRDDEIENFPGNATLRFAGIAVTGDTASTGTYDVAANPATDLHQAVCGLGALEAEAAGDSALTDEERATAGDAAGRGATALPLDSEFFTAARRFSESVGWVVPTGDDPVRPADDPVEALALRLQIRLALEADPDDVVAHPAGDDFPGAVPADAERISRTVSIDGTYAGYPGHYGFSGAGSPVWRSTGLYAAPGDVVTITVPARVVDTGISVQIGAHTDRLWGKDAWERAPQITRREGIATPEHRIASGFGGLVYVLVPAGLDLGTFDATIAGAVAAPRYLHGTTTDMMWRNTQRTLAGPWAELETDGVVLMVPSADIRELDAPSEPMAFWQDAMAAAADLAGMPRDRDRDERFLVDRQISNGWMHSGYPVMAHLVSSSEVIDIDQLESGDVWGPFHEFGHNHQWDDTVLPGTIETTCNLWSVYLNEEVAGVSRDATHPAISPASRASRIADWRSDPDFERWSVWMALETYLQLQEAFGWDLLIDVFTEYRELDDADRPAGNHERIQQWVIRTSNAAGRDLTDFYDAWSFPMDDATRAAVAGLPDWADHPMR